MDLYREEIKRMLTPLTNEQRLLFAVLTCERLYPNYIYFQNIFNWGDSKILLNAIGVVYQFLIKRDLFEKHEIQELINEVDIITPNTEDFSEIFVSFALDACTSIYSSLNFILDHELEHIVDVAIYAHDTIDMFIQERDNLSYDSVDIEDRIAADPLMIYEKERQNNVIHRLSLKKEVNVNNQLIEELRDKTPIINLSMLE
jgi:uncharacterized protein YjaG (DUF416 family)